MLLLAGDIGGTKTDLAIFSHESGPRVPLAEASFASGRYASLETLVGEFLSQSELRVEQASFGVAGPVVGNRAVITNLPWVVEAEQLRQAFGFSSVSLLNDLVAVANSITILGQADLYTLQEGQPEQGGAIAVVAPGTGLGEAFMVWDGERYRAYPSEGGHADFAPMDSLQMGLLSFLRDRFGHVSYERVCSGNGLPSIYAFLKEAGDEAEPDWLAERLIAAEDPTPVIVSAALDKERPCRLCRAALDVFVSALGGEAGNLALKVVATGGVYVGGGIPLRILPALTGGLFRAAFHRKGRLSSLLSRMPVHVIVARNAALIGAARYGLRSA